MADLVDDLSKSGHTHVKFRTLIVASDDSFEILSRSKQGTWQRLTRVEGNEHEVGNALTAALRKVSKQGILLRIDSGRAVLQTLTLPAVAGDVLPAVIRNKVESLAPWPLPQALWGYRIALSNGLGQIQVEAAIVSRSSVDSLLSLLASAGVKPVALDIAEPYDPLPGITIDIGAPERRRAALRTVRVLMGGIFLAAAAAAAYGGMLAYDTYRQQSELDQHIADLRRDLTRSGRDLSPALVAANKLYKRKIAEQPVVSVLNSLTKVIPDDIWLNSINLAAGRVTISGQGVDIPALVEKLEASDSFADVNFAAATQRSPDEPSDEFSIAARIEPRDTAK